MNPLFKHIKISGMPMILVLATLIMIHKHEAMAGGLVSKSDRKSHHIETVAEELMEIELDEKRTLAEEKNPSKKQRINISDESERIIALLRQHGVILYDWVTALEAITSFDSLKNALKAYVGRSYAKIPNDKEILKQLKNLLANVRAMNLTEGELSILSSNDMMNKIESFYSIGLSKQKKVVPIIDYEAKWKKLQSESDFDLHFYEHLYDALAKEDVVMSSRYPDETDQVLNEYPENLALLNRRHRLIIFLASIKNPNKPREISSKIRADRDERVPYSTSENSPSWFHDKRYKLYKIAEQLPSMTTEDKGILLSSFLHAGQHCSVAKRFQIEQSYKRFAHADAVSLEAEIAGKDLSLEDRIELTLGSSKDRILDNLSRAALEREKEKARGARIGLYSLNEFDAEEVTFYDATYDAYAHNFGLKKRDCPYRIYRLNISSLEAYGNRGYRIKTILSDIKRELGDKISQDLAGDLNHVLKDPDLLLVGFLKQKHFIVEPESEVAKAFWNDHNNPVNDLRPEPVTAR